VAVRSISQALAAVLVVVVTAVAPASAAAPDGTNQARLDRTVRFLQDVQNPDGGFGGRRGSASDVLFSCWVAVGLAAAGVNPRDQARPGGVDLYAFIERNTTRYEQTTDYERTLLAVLAAGESGRDLGGVDLVAAILARQLPDGGFPQTPAGSQGWINATTFAILPLSRIDEPVARQAVQRAADWLIAGQNANGSWAASSVGSPQDVDMTGAVLQALSRAGRRDSDAVRRALDFLRTVQGTDGGFAANAPGGESNSGSTAWVVQGLWAAGVDPRTWDRGGGDPLDYLASMQQPDGSIAWKRSDPAVNPVWMTAYAAPAYAGQPLPVPAPPRRAPGPLQQPPADPGTGAPAPDAAGSGQGGLGAERGGGVIAGGGGRGAPLFSRPQPQSQGRTPGGARGLDRRRRGAAERSRATGSSGTGHGSGPEGAPVSGRVIDGLGSARRRARPIAPGLRAAQAGGVQESGLALGLAGALLLSAALGSQLERRRCAEAAR
jgi:prenyltransferase beta subunit